MISSVMCTLAIRTFVKRTPIIFDRFAGTITFRTRGMGGNGTGGSWAVNVINRRIDNDQSA
ncbi:MAG: hypothetical protein AAFO86_04935 [Pseudomonadota bacterium]